MIFEEAILKRITPKNDIIFKKIFGSKGNEGILKDFLEGILGTKIESVKLGLETEMLPDFYIGKNSRLDVRAELKDGTFVNVEIQTNTENYSDKRDLVYWSKLYLKALEKGNDYKETRKTICIWIVDGIVYDFEKYHSKWEITETDIGKTMYFKDFEIHVIELQKFRKIAIMKPDKKEFWLWFIDHTKKELVDMACYSNEQVEEARRQLDKITADKDLMTLIIADEMDEMDRIARIKRDEKIKREIEEGKRNLEEGKRNLEEEKRNLEEERRRIEKIKKDANEKIENAEKMGKLEANEEIVKKMLELGVEVEFIEKATGLSKEEIENLK